MRFSGDFDVGGSIQAFVSELIAARPSRFLRHDLPSNFDCAVLKDMQQVKYVIYR